MKIFVSGSLRNVPKNSDLCEVFVQKLGEEIVKRNHILLTGCSGSLDKKIAESSAEFLGSSDAAKKQIHSYVVEDQEDNPAHNVGTIFSSELKNWNLEGERANLPEQIELADVTIFIAGSEGTFKGSHLATFAKKPVIGIGMFGGAGKKIFQRERQNFEKKYTHLIDPYSYNDLNQVTDDIQEYAKSIVDICENLRRSKQVFCMMSFKSEYDDVFGLYESICTKYDLKAVRTDHDPNLTPITTRILEGIEGSDFVIADVSELSPNVFYEIGYSKGIKRPVILTAKKGTELPFDIKDLPVIFYERLNLKTELEQPLEKYINGLTNID